MGKFLKEKTVIGICGFVMGTLLMISPMVAYAASPPDGFWQESTVGADGVRHRRTPGYDGEILGLMYKGEKIWINPSAHVPGYAVWVCMWREKTELTGWMEWSYFDHE